MEFSHKPSLCSVSLQNWGDRNVIAVHWWSIEFLKTLKCLKRYPVDKQFPAWHLRCAVLWREGPRWIQRGSMVFASAHPALVPTGELPHEPPERENAATTSCHALHLSSLVKNGRNWIPSYIVLPSFRIHCLYSIYKSRGFFISFFCFVLFVHVNSFGCTT